MKMKPDKPASSGKPFIKFPYALARLKLKLRTKVVAAALMGYGWTKGAIYPSQDRVAEELNLSQRSVRDSIRELEVANLFRSQRVGKTCNNRYYPSKVLAE